MACANAADGNAQPAFTEAQIQEVDRLMEETPRIDAALKTYLSLLMAQGLVSSTNPAGAASSGSTLSGSAAALAWQACARTLFRKLNDLALVPAPEWGLSHPQRDDEAGMNYIARLGQYRVVHALWEKCRQANQKPTKCLGRSVLRVVYPDVAAALLNDLKGASQEAKVPEEFLRLFVEGFGRTLEPLADDASSLEGDAALVWAGSVRQALGVRHEARAAEAAERLQRASSAEAFAEELRTAVSGATVATPGPTIEDVTQ